jgi:hypothetical protein
MGLRRSCWVGLVGLTQEAEEWGVVRCGRFGRSAGSVSAPRPIPGVGRGNVRDRTRWALLAEPASPHTLPDKDRRRMSRRACASAGARGRSLASAVPS